MKQELLYITPFDKEYGHQTVPYPFKKEPKRVWTCIPFNIKPTLPMVPKHHENAFLEDKMHDWDIAKGIFHYMSRVETGDCWLLLEFEE